MESPYKEILIAIGGGSLVFLIQIAQMITGRIDAKRKERQEKEDKEKEESKIHLSNNAELKRLEHESDEAVNAELWRIITAKNLEIQALEEKCKELNMTDSLSRPTLTRIYAAVRKLGRQIEILDSLIVKELAHKDLMLEMEILRQKFNELEQHLP
jgi:hypothetical protein